MDRFEAIFGIRKKEVTRTVLLLPFLPQGALDIFGVKKLAAGAVFASGSTDDLTIIKTGIGPRFVGDAVLYLEETPCSRIMFLGSCGLIEKKPGLGIGSLVTPTAAYALESFSDIVTGRLQGPNPSFPNTTLLHDFIETTGLDPRPLACASFCSLSQEESFRPFFKKLGADVVEMECAALFHAAAKAGKSAIALLFVSDILGEKPFFQKPGAGDKKSLADGISQACKAIRKFASN